MVGHSTSELVTPADKCFNGLPEEQGVEAWMWTQRPFSTAPRTILLTSEKTLRDWISRVTRTYSPSCLVTTFDADSSLDKQNLTIFQHQGNLHLYESTVGIDSSSKPRVCENPIQPRSKITARETIQSSRPSPKQVQQTLVTETWSGLHTLFSPHIKPKWVCARLFACLLLGRFLEPNQRPQLRALLADSLVPRGPKWRTGIRRGGRLCLPLQPSAWSYDTSSSDFLSLLDHFTQ